MFRKGLVPLDGTDMAEGILPYVGQLARGLGMPLVLISVIDPESVETPERLRIPVESTALGRIRVSGYGAATPSETNIETSRATVAGVHPHEVGGTYVSQIFERVEEDVKKHLEKKADELRATGLTVESKVVFGAAAEQIVKAAEDEDADFIAMSTHGRGAIGRGVLGSVTDKVAHIAHVPVLAITPEKAEQYWQATEPLSKIMVPLDGSLLAETALSYAENLAVAMNLGIVLVRVLKIGGAYTGYADGYTYFQYPDLDNKIEEEAIEYLRSTAFRLLARGLDAEWKVLRGSPSASIVELARETPQDLIVITTHGRSGVTRWFLGSVAEGLVRSSGDPVLIIPTTEDN